MEVKGVRSLLCVVAVLWVGAGFPVITLADVPSSERTAAMPDSWLILYNLNNPDSVTWQSWYRQQRSIPEENVLGLDASACEHLADLATAQEQILDPVLDFLNTNPEVEQRLMGIVLGYGLPGHYGSPPIIPGVGGYSITNALQDMTNTMWWGGNSDCPHMAPPYGVMPPGGRLTKATIRCRHYMVARIDGASLAEAQALTIRAKTIENGEGGCRGEPSVWYDYLDPAIPGGEWTSLKDAVEDENLEDTPWQPFDADTEQTPNDAFRFGTHDTTDWDDVRLFGTPTGNRIVAFNLNSWGATTVRSCTAEGGRYVPNALAAGYAAAIGATGEPQYGYDPYPDTFLESMREGWTLGEAFYLSNPYDDWMWEIVGDPFMIVPEWFNEEPLAGDVNNDGMLNLQDLAGFRACLSGPGGTSDPVCDSFDFDGDGDFDLADYAGFQQGYTDGPVEPATGDFNGDENIDLDDFAAFVGCMAGVRPSAIGDGCDVFDFDFDLDVDVRDFRTLQSFYAGGD